MMTDDHAVTPPEEDARSLQEKLDQLARTLSSAGRALLQAMRASQEDVQGYWPQLMTHY